MNVRDAVEADTDALATLADVPPDVIRNVIHDRTVRVADRGPDGSAENRAEVTVAESTDTAECRLAEGGPAEPIGFVSFDARDGVVHVTQFGGPGDVCERLLSEPIRFAEIEGMEVEVLVAVDDDEMRAAVETVGFEKRGTGPLFEGRETVRYRLQT